MDRTPASLLRRLKDLTDGESWDRFVDLYGPLVLRYLRKLGVPDEDALDLNQEVLSIVMVQIGQGKFQYDPTKYFRAWLRTIARNLAYRYFRNRGREQPGQGGTDNLVAVQEMPDGEEPQDDVFEQQWRDRCLEIATREVRGRVNPRTWQAFVLLASGEEPKEVAEQLKMTVGHAYVCKCKVIKMLREEVEKCDE